MMVFWRVVTAWLILALVCWHSSHYTFCDEQYPDAETLPPQDISLEEESAEKTEQHKDEKTLELDPQLKHELLTAGDQGDEVPVAPGLEEETQRNEEAVEMERPTAELHQEQEEHEAEVPSPQNATPQDLEEASTPEPALPPSDHVFAAPEDPLGTLTAPDLPPGDQDLPPGSASEKPVFDATAGGPADGDQAPALSEDGEDNPFDGESPPVVLENTSNVHSAGTRTHPDPSASLQASQGTPGPGQVVNSSHGASEMELSPPVAVETDSSTGTKDPEDIPTFDEWKRKVMEVEKEKTQATHASSNGAPHPVKKVQKNFNNYASVECGAKILGANPEAKSKSAILMENMDVYMLNPCSNKIWFIIELCEPIQLKQLDIANFELFSSTPKDFLVSISDRYPTNKWLKLGTFHARDERTVQSFPLDEHLYAKYIKVELISHFGSEHFCPLSLIRVYGTSMVEEYEDNLDPERPDDQDDDYEYPHGYIPGEVKSSKNLIGSAKDVILNMVNNIAVNVLGGSQDMEGNFSSQGNMTESLSGLDTINATITSTTPSFIPDAEEEEGRSGPDVPVVEEGPSYEAPVLDAPTTDTPEQEPYPEEEKMTTPLQEEEDSISSTIILLGKEDEEEEMEDKLQKRHQESVDYCGLHYPASFSYSCSVSLQEYLHMQCSALRPRQVEHQVLEREAPVSSPTPTPTLIWQLPLSPSACPTSQLPDPEIHHPQVEEHTPLPAQTEVTPLEQQNPPTEFTEDEGARSSDHLLLEPSQSSALPKPSHTESPPFKATPAFQEPPLLSTKDLPAEQKAEGSPESQAEEEQKVPTTTTTDLSTSSSDQPSVTVEQLGGPAAEKPEADATAPEVDVFTQAADPTEHPHPPLPASSAPSEQQPSSPAALETEVIQQEALHPTPSAAATEPSLPSSHIISAEPRVEDLMEDIPGNEPLPQPSSPVPLPPSSSALSTGHPDIYAELHNGTEQGNGNQVHGSSQKESVFMRLNNRIKALEVNMSLSGRYLEQLSQRYRKQMEEMQRAFNKTIIKLQNTSRVAEEQDQRQTESIQSLQGQLENITQLVLNLSVRVSQLQREVSDRQSYLLLSLLLFLFLGLLLCSNNWRLSTAPPPTEVEPAIPKSYSYCCPDREFDPLDDPSLRRRASYPLLHPESYEMTTTEGPESLRSEETQRLSPANRRRKRSNVKHGDSTETLCPPHTAAGLPNGVPICNGAPRLPNATLLSLQPVFRDSPSEGSSEASSHSDDPSFCGITTACTRLCDGLPPPRTRAERRALRRKRSKPNCTAVDLPNVRRGISQAPPITRTQELTNKNKELSSGTSGASVPFSGPT